MKRSIPLACRDLIAALVGNGYLQQKFVTERTGLTERMVAEINAKKQGRRIRPYKYGGYVTYDGLPGQRLSGR